MLTTCIEFNDNIPMCLQCHPKLVYCFATVSSTDGDGRSMIFPNANKPWLVIVKKARPPAPHVPPPQHLTVSTWASRWYSAYLPKAYRFRKEICQSSLNQNMRCCKPESKVFGLCTLQGKESTKGCWAKYGFIMQPRVAECEHTLVKTTSDTLRWSLKLALMPKVRYLNFMLIINVPLVACASSIYVTLIKYVHPRMLTRLRYVVFNVISKIVRLWFWDTNVGEQPMPLWKLANLKSHPPPRSIRR